MPKGTRGEAAGAAEPGTREGTRNVPEERHPRKWADVKSLPRVAPRRRAAAGYKQLLQSLAVRPRWAGGRARRPGHGPAGDDGNADDAGQPEHAAVRERNVFSADDVLGLAAAAPAPKEPLKPDAQREREGAARSLAAILREALAGARCPRSPSPGSRPTPPSQPGRRCSRSAGGQAAHRRRAAGVRRRLPPHPEQAQKDKTSKPSTCSPATSSRCTRRSPGRAIWKRRGPRFRRYSASRTGWPRRRRSRWCGRSSWPRG
jgi:hypothetical protein